MKYIFKVSDNVLHWLETYPSLRDDDFRLLANVWHDELAALNIDKAHFLKTFAIGQLTSAESICRIRRKLQQENEHLRGEKYLFRIERGNDLKIKFKTEI